MHESGIIARFINPRNIIRFSEGITITERSLNFLLFPPVEISIVLVNESNRKVTSLSALGIQHVANCTMAIIKNTPAITVDGSIADSRNNLKLAFWGFAITPIKLSRKPIKVEIQVATINVQLCLFLSYKSLFLSPLLISNVVISVFILAKPHCAPH